MQYMRHLALHGGDLPSAQSVLFFLVIRNVSIGYATLDRLRGLPELSMHAVVCQAV